MNGEGTKVLVADDDAFVADLLAMILHSSGYSVDTAENGRQAWEKFNQGKDYQLIISDMNMPEMSGLELITEIRSCGADVPIVILTGNNEISVAIQAIKEGANDYLLKDENIQETILIAVEKVLKKHQLTLENQQLMLDIETKNREMEREKAIACRVQENILPKQLNFQGFETGTFYLPSDKIGGDFFDAWENEHYVHFLIGDISGHSTSSALIMAVCKGMFPSLGQTMDDPAAIVTKANQMLVPILMDSGMFLTLVLVSYEKRSNQVRAVSAGHNPVYLMKIDGLVTVESSGPVLGWDPDDSWETSVHRFEVGETLFLYTDGLVESRNKAGVEFGDTLLNRLEKNNLAPADLVEMLYAQLNEFCEDKLDDDLTLFAIRKI